MNPFRLIRRRGWTGLLLLLAALLPTLAPAAEPPETAARSATEERPVPVKVGVLTDNFPFSFRDDGGRMQGFVFELAGELERVMGLRFERVLGPTEEINGAFRRGQLDLLQSYAQFAEREDHADFSVPYLTMSGAIFVGQGVTGIRSLEDLRGRRVLVHRGSLGAKVLERAGLGASIVYVNSVEQALTGVDAGRGDATLASRLSGLAAAKRLRLAHLRPLDVPVAGYEVRYCFAVRDGDRELLAKLNEGLAVLVRLGTFDRVYQRWFGHIEPTHYSALQIALAVAVGLAVALLVALWAVMRLTRLQRRIEKQAEVLRSSEERYRTVFDGEQDGLLVLGPGGGNCVVEQINPAARAMTGGGSVGGSLPTLAHWLATETALCARVETIVARREAVEFEYEAAEGKRHWRVAVSPLGASALMRMSDVTEAVKLRRREQEREAQLRNAQKLEAIGTLAGGVAHDFNNLLTVIMGNADLCLMGLPESGRETDHVRKVLEAARRGRQLVRQVLTFSKRTEPARERLALAPVIDEMVSFLRTVARDSVDFELRRGAPLPEIVADSAQLHQVLMNVGTNAVQAMRGTRGRLTVTEDLVEVGDEVRAQHPQVAPGRYVRIGFHDTGPGMTPEVQARIFEPYFTTKSAAGGTGLGLSVVHGIMQLHGGAVTVYSQPGRGTLFHLYFPVPVTEAVSTADTLAEVPRGAGELVLLVDDDAAVGRTAQLVLERLGYRVSRHGHALGALRDFESRATDFALVLTDLAMPDQTGLDLVRRIRRGHERLPVVVMSGFFSRAEEDALVDLGVTQRLNKPLTLASVGRALAAALRAEG